MRDQVSLKELFAPSHLIVSLLYGSPLRLASLAVLFSGLEKIISAYAQMNGIAQEANPVVNFVILSYVNIPIAHLIGFAISVFGAFFLYRMAKISKDRKARITAKICLLSITILFVLTFENNLNVILS